ncbi:hypothetical protein BLNAU_11384 [Blattamonas nauphoetae]|uniref:Uncharacterized protein n=1 Tax=Blattamonas nauphoetae TaxID=2049346 RepID=A0ABQ9XMP5_9EUKA|nr:hypothetical protein BLNAU_11384 [Blattamonas nauphoetae]
MISEQSVVNGDLSPSALNPPPSKNLSNISSLLEVLQCEKEEIIVDTLRTFQKVASGVSFSFADSLFLRQKDFIFSTFNKFGESSPPSAVLTTLARISLFPHLRIAIQSSWALYHVVQRDQYSLTQLPSPIFPYSSPHQQYSGLSFLAALTQKLRIVISDFQRNLPTDPSHLPKFIQLTKNDQFIISRSLSFCSNAVLLPALLLDATPPIEVDSEIIRELILFVKEALTMILTNISNIDSLIASLPSDSSATTQLVSKDDPQMIDSLKELRNKCEDFMSNGWYFSINLSKTITDHHDDSFQTVMLDDPSFPDLILNFLKLDHKVIRGKTVAVVTNIAIRFKSMKKQFMKANLVERMFETVDFVSLPLSEPKILLDLTKFITNLFLPVEDDEEAQFEQYPLIRVSVIITPVLIRLKQFSSAEHYIALLLSTDRSDFALQSAITFFATTRKEDSALSLWKELVDSKVKQADKGNGDWDEDQFTFLHASLIDFRQYSHQFSTSAFECLINQYQIRGVQTLITLTANLNFFSLLIDNSYSFPHSSQSTHPDFETLALQRAEMMLQMSQEFLRNTPDGINADFTTWQHSFYTLAWNEGVDQFSKSNFHSSISFFMLCLLIDLSQSESISTEVSPIPLHSFSSLSIKVPVSPSPNLVPLIRTISFAYLSSQNITEAESACQFLATLEGSTTLSPLSRLLTLKLALRKGNLDEAKTIATALIESHSSDTPARSGMLVDETDPSTPPPLTPATTIPTDTSALLDVLESVAQEFESVGEPEFCLAFLREYLNSFELTGSKGEQAGKLEKKMFALVQMLQLHTHHPEASWDLKEMGQLFTTLKDTVIELHRRHHNWKDDSKGMIDWCYRCAWNAGIEAGHRSEMTICVSCFESALFFLHHMDTQPLVSAESIQQVKRTARVELSNAKKDNVIVPKEEERTCHMMIASSQLDYIRSNTLDSHTKTQLARQARNHLNITTSDSISTISSLLETLRCNDEDIMIETLRELHQVASDSKSPSFVRSSLSSYIPFFTMTQFGDWSHCAALESDFILSTFEKIGAWWTPSAVLTTLARLSLFPHLRIATHSLSPLHSILIRDQYALTQLPSPIFTSSSPLQQYSGLSFLAALTKKLRIVFSEFQTNIPTDLSHLLKYMQFTKDDTTRIDCSLFFSSVSFIIPILIWKADPPIEVDSEIIRELILFVKDALTTILTNISNIDTLIASLPSDSSPTTPLVSDIDKQMAKSLEHLRHESEDFVKSGLVFFSNLMNTLADPHKSSFQTIILDDPSFPDLILNSLKLNHKEIRENTLMAIFNIIYFFPRMSERFMTANLVERMFETVDFVSLPLSESETLFVLTRFLASILCPIGDDEESRFEQCPFIRVSVFEPAKQYIIFLFHNSDKLILDNYSIEMKKTQLEDCLCWIHYRIKNLELRSDEHDIDFVSELVKWEVQTMVEMEYEAHFEIVFQSMLNSTREWNQDKRERQKRREVLLREEGWDDAFELRVVGIERNTDQRFQDSVKSFRIELTFNADVLG